MEVISGYKIFGLLAFLLIAAAAALVLYKSEIDLTKSISKHAALGRRGFIVFAIASTVAIFLFYLFMYYYFVPTFKLPAAFEYVLVLGLGLQLAAAWIPDYNDKQLSSRVHGMAAYSMAALMPVLLVCIARSPEVSFIMQVICWIVPGIMITYSVGYVLIKNLKRHYLVHQSLYILLFYLAILLVTYS